MVETKTRSPWPQSFEEKPWGKNWPTHLNEYTHSEYLEIDAGGFSSQHKHEKKTNVFIVHSGELELRWWSGLPCDSDFTVGLLSERQVHVFQPGIVHQFIARSFVVVSEVYTQVSDGAIDRNDIVRFSENGVLAK